MLWHADLLLGNNRNINNYKTGIAELSSRVEAG
jgi:hypothetical protein